MISSSAPLDRDAPPAKPPNRRVAWHSIAPAAGLGLSAGILALLLGDLDLRWIVYAVLAACFAGTLLLASNVRLYLLGVFVLSLQANVAVAWMMQSSSSAGISGPLAINLPASVMAGSLVLMHHLLTRGSGQKFLVWDRRLTPPALLFFLASTISLINSSERLMGVFFLIGLMEVYLLFVMIINVVKTDRDLAIINNLFLIMLLIQALVYFVENATGATFTLTGEVFQQQGELQRHGGTVSTNSLAYGKFITPLLLVTISRFLTARDRRSMRWPALVLFLSMAALVLTFARSVWSGVIISTAVLVFTGLRARLLRIRLVIGMVAGAALVIIVLLPSIMLRLGANLSADYHERHALMQMAIHIIEAHPLVGVGAGAYPYVFRRYIPYELQGEWLYMVHNVYLLRGAEVGIPGVIAFVWLLLAGTREAFIGVRARNKEVAAMAAGIGAGLVGMMWEKYWDSGSCFPNDALLFVLFGLAVVVGGIARSEAAEGRRRRPRTTGPPSAVMG